MILQGYRCRCGSTHYQNASYYVSVADSGRVVLALGPFAEHDDALANVERVSRHVEERRNPQGRACWYSYGTVAMPCGYRVPGRCNQSLADAEREEAEAAKHPKPRTKKRQIVAYRHRGVAR